MTTRRLGDLSTILNPALIWQALALFYMGNGNKKMPMIYLCQTVLDNFGIDYPDFENFGHQFVVEDIPIDDTNSTVVLVRSDSSSETIEVICDATVLARH